MVLPQVGRQHFEGVGAYAEPAADKAVDSAQAAAPSAGKKGQPESPTVSPHSVYSIDRTVSTADSLGERDEPPSAEKLMPVRLNECLTVAHEAAPEADEQKPENVQARGSDPHSHVAWEPGVVTVMIRQVPREFTQLMFLSELIRRGFKGQFDFIYFPFDLKKGSNIGYGFVNFVEPHHTLAFVKEFDFTYLDAKMQMRGKPLRVHPASMQGYEANYEHFSQTKTVQKQNPLLCPLFFPGGSWASVPEVITMGLAALQEEAPGSLGALPATALAAGPLGAAAAPPLCAAPPCAEYPWHVEASLGQGGPSWAASVAAAAEAAAKADFSMRSAMEAEALYRSTLALNPGVTQFHSDPWADAFQSLEEKRHQLLLELAAVQEEQRMALVNSLLVAPGASQQLTLPPGLPAGLESYPSYIAGVPAWSLPTSPASAAARESHFPL